MVYKIHGYVKQGVADDAMGGDNEDSVNIRAEPKYKKIQIRAEPKGSFLFPLK